jgi:hypothetical protein
MRLILSTSHPSCDTTDSGQLMKQKRIPQILVYMCCGQLGSLVVAEQQLIEDLRASRPRLRSVSKVKRDSCSAGRCKCDVAHQRHDDGACRDRQSLPGILHHIRRILKACTLAAATRTGMCSTVPVAAQFTWRRVQRVP